MDAISFWLNFPYEVTQRYEGLFHKDPKYDTQNNEIILTTQDDFDENNSFEELPF